MSFFSKVLVQIRKLKEAANLRARQANEKEIEAHKIQKDSIEPLTETLAVQDKNQKSEGNTD